LFRKNDYLKKLKNHKVKKMQRSKIIKVSVLGLVLGLILMGFVIGVNASNRRATVKHRPLRHYVKNNPNVFYYWIGPFPTYDYVLELAEGAFPLGGDIPPQLGTYSGSIEERKLPDGRAEITVYLSAQGIHFWIWDFIDGDLVMEGLVDWYYEVERIIIDRPGAEIPNLFDLDYPDENPYIAGSGTGYGIFTEDADGFTPGAEGMFHLFQHGEGYDWPYEILDLSEL
jgi:hypothetical protein